MAFSVIFQPNLANWRNSMSAAKDANTNKMKLCISESRALMNFALNEMPIMTRNLNPRDTDAGIVFAGNLASQHFQECMARPPARPNGR
jgi:hypothetical protein